MFIHIQTREPIIYFKYQDILCWGSNSVIFQFKVFGHVFGREKEDVEVILVDTKEAKTIEKVTLESVRSLMKDMDKSAISNQDFQLLTAELKASGNGVDDEFDQNAFSLIRQFAATRVFTTHQGVMLMETLKDRDPFMLLEIAIFLYDNTLNCDSFQIILNTFSDPTDRQNVIDRLKPIGGPSVDLLRANLEPPRNEEPLGMCQKRLPSVV